MMMIKGMKLDTDPSIPKDIGVISGSTSGAVGPEKKEEARTCSGPATQYFQCDILHDISNNSIF